MSVERTCNSEVYLAQPDEPICEAANRMLQCGVGCLIVIDDERKPVGMLTDRDLTVRAVAGARDARSTTVREMMTAQPRVIIEGTPIEDALAIMRSGHFRRLPVVDADRHLVGLVTADDMITLLADELNEVRELLEAQSP